MGADTLVGGNDIDTCRGGLRTDTADPDCEATQDVPKS
jgi:hypothetical protein